MRKIKKIVTGVLACSMLISSSVSVSAYYPYDKWYSFIEAWNGGKSATVLIDSLKPDEHILYIENKQGKKVIEPEYTAEYLGKYTKLTLSEKVLNELEPKNGTNYLEIYIAGGEDVSDEYCWFFYNPSEKDNKIRISKDNQDLIKVLKVTNGDSSDSKDADETELSGEDYKVTENNEEFVIEISEDYLKKAPSTTYKVYCQENYYALVQLVKGKLGDANADGRIDINDAKEVLKTALGVERESTQILMLADYDNDGKITLTDANSCLKAALGINKTK